MYKNGKQYDSTTEIKVAVKKNHDYSLPSKLFEKLIDLMETWLFEVNMS